VQVQVTVEDDPDRVLQLTQSLLRDAAPSDSAFRPVHGYNVRQITSDRRFRLAERLQSKGLAGGGYAHQVLSEMHYGAAPRRVDSLTSEQRGGCAMPRFG